MAGTGEMTDTLKNTMSLVWQGNISWSNQPIPVCQCLEGKTAERNSSSLLANLKAGVTLRRQTAGLGLKGEDAKRLNTCRWSLGRRELCSNKANTRRICLVITYTHSWRSKPQHSSSRTDCALSGYIYIYIFFIIYIFLLYIYFFFLGPHLLNRYMAYTDIWCISVNLILLIYPSLFFPLW